LITDWRGLILAAGGLALAVLPGAVLFGAIF